MKFNLDKKILNILSILLFILFVFLSLVNYFSTTYIITSANKYKEYAFLKWDNFFFTTLIIVILLIIAFLINSYKKITNISTRTLRIIVSVFICIAGFIWIYIAQTFPVHDQSNVSKAAYAFIRGDYSMLESGNYLHRYPHQLGIVMIFQLLYSTIGRISFISNHNYVIIMVLNVILVCGIFNILFMILKTFTSSSKIYNLYWIFAFFTLAPVFYCTFVYGTIIGLFFGVLGVCLMINFFKTNKYRFYVTSFLSFAVACISKSNYKIFVIAAILVLLFQTINQKKKIYILLAIILTFSMTFSSFVNMYYSAVSGINIGKGTPSLLWVSMGFQEGTMGNGWYNRYNASTYDKVDGDYDKANQIAKENIRDSIEKFKKNPLYLSNFLFIKTASQWNDPSFQCFWMSDYDSNHYGTLTPVADSIYHGTLNKILLKIMDTLTLFIWLGNAIFFFTKRKSITIEQLFLGIIIIGGFMFHLFWEAKALYIMPYFFISLVGGVCGCGILFKKFNLLIHKLILL